MSEKPAGTLNYFHPTPAYHYCSARSVVDLFWQSCLEHWAPTHLDPAPPSRWRLPRQHGRSVKTLLQFRHVSPSERVRDAGDGTCRGGAGLDVADLSTDTQAQPDAPRPRRLGNRAAPGASTRWTASYMPDVHARGSRAERWRARIPPRCPIPDEVAAPDTGRSCGARYRAKLRCLIPVEVAVPDTG